MGTDPAGARGRSPLSEKKLCVVCAEGSSKRGPDRPTGVQTTACVRMRIWQATRETPTVPAQRDGKPELGDELIRAVRGGGEARSSEETG